MFYPFQPSNDKYTQIYSVVSRKYVAYKAVSETFTWNADFEDNTSKK